MGGISDIATFKAELVDFTEFGTATQLGETFDLPTYLNEFWTAKQRADGANSLHEVSYRACFKPQLPRFFIDRLSAPGESVYDPFMGRGTTPLEAALAGRIAAGNDANPLSQMLLRPRLAPPTREEVSERLKKIPWQKKVDCPDELLVFYHPDTLQQLCALRSYLLGQEADGTIDHVDRWIRMVAINRLTGHSAGFFSVYTLPPNQAVSVERQKKINEHREQTPPNRDVPSLIEKKTRTLLKDIGADERQVLASYVDDAVLLCAAADDTSQLADESVVLTVTSPPFLDVVDYKGDNWLRCWFGGIDVESVHLTVMSSLEIWKSEMHKVFVELARVTRTGGYVAFEVGEVRNGTVKLEEAVIEAAVGSGLSPKLVMINVNPTWTKTAKIWGVDNQAKGTNSNRIVLLQKDATP